MSGYPGRYAMRWILDDAIREAPPGAVWIEVGCGIGRGLHEMGRVIREAGRHDIALYAVDPWGGYHRNGEQAADGEPSLHGDWRLFLRTMLAHDPETLETLRILRLTSAQAARAFIAQSAHLIVLDAEHTDFAVSADIAAWFPVVQHGGWIAGDDHHETEYPGVVAACGRAFGSDYEARAAEHDWPTWRKRVTR